MQRDPDDLALTTAVIAMAYSVGMTVVAEGVRWKRSSTCCARDCDLARGYWLGHAVSAPPNSAIC